MLGEEKSTNTFRFARVGLRTPKLKMSCIVETKAVVEMKMLMKPLGWKEKEWEREKECERGKRKSMCVRDR